MTKDKNQNGSSSFHTSRTRIKSSRIAHNKKVDRQIFKGARRTVLTIIGLAMLTVILTMLLTFFAKPEHIIKHEIENIASDYYENFFYPELTTDNASFEQVMERYTKVGLSRISLRQLLLFDEERYSSASDIVKTYCDENETFIQIYPEPPFGRTDYHIDYHYACIF